MENILMGINVFLTIFFWRCATAAFEEGKDNIGWVQIFFSAFNGASVAAVIF